MNKSLNERVHSAEDDVELARELIALDKQMHADPRPLFSTEDSVVVDLLGSVLRTGAKANRIQFGPFEMRTFRGAGAYGTVWEAIDERSQERIAIKIPHPHLMASSDLAERYGREVAALKEIRHPNVLSVRELFQADSNVALAMDYCDGPSLAEWLQARGEAVPVRLAAEIVMKLARGVEECHRHGIVHGDIKPPNVLLFRTESESPFTFEPRLTDFGLAVLSQEPRRTGESSLWRGTLEYMSPEQIAGEPNSRSVRSDVYALGVLLYELLMREPPFTGKSVVEVMAQIIDQSPVRPRLRRPDVPQCLDNIILQCLSKTPTARYQSAGELAGELSSFLTDGQVKAHPEIWRYQIARRVQRKERVVEAGILTVVIYGTLIIWFSTATVMAAIGVPWLPAHVTVSKMALDCVKMGVLNSIAIAAAIEMIRGNKWGAIVATVLGFGSTILSAGNLTGVIQPPFDGVYANDLKLQVVVFSLLTVLCALQTIATGWGWYLLSTRRMLSP